MGLDEVAANEFDPAVDVAALAYDAADELAHFSILDGQLKHMFVAPQSHFHGLPQDFRRNWFYDDFVARAGQGRDTFGKALLIAKANERRRQFRLIAEFRGNVRDSLGVEDHQIMRFPHC